MNPESQQMIEYIVQLTRKPGLSIDENTPLVSSGISSLDGASGLLLKLEDLTTAAFPPAKCNPRTWIQRQKCSPRRSA